MLFVNELGFTDSILTITGCSQNRHAKMGAFYAERRQNGHTPISASIGLTKQGSVIFWFMAILGKVYPKCHMATTALAKRVFILAKFLNLCGYGDTAYTDAKCLIASKA